MSLFFQSHRENRFIENSQSYFAVKLRFATMLNFIDIPNEIDRLDHQQNQRLFNKQNVKAVRIETTDAIK